MHASIPLTQGKTALVDVEDLPMLSQHKWFAFAARNRDGVRDCWYAATVIDGRRTYMHHVLMGQPSEVIDHRDGDGLNNTKRNLRACTQQQNLWNRNCLNRDNKSGFIGVCWDKARSKWKAYIQVDGKLCNLGRFNSAEEAAKAYDKKAIETRGEFARPNFPLVQTVNQYLI